jgi:hypothetical protein
VRVMWHSCERRRKYSRFWWESQKERDHSENRVVDGRVGSDLILERLARLCGVDSVGSGYGPMAGFCEHCDEPASSGATDLELL